MKEKVKIILETLKTAIFVFVSALFAMFAFAVLNHELLAKDEIVAYGLICGICFCISAFVVFLSWFLRELKKMEDV